MIAPILFFVIQMKGRFVIIGYGSALIIFIGFLSLAVFVRSLFQLLTGHTQGSVD